MTTDAQAERGQFTEPNSHIDTEQIIEDAWAEGWEGDEDWEDAAKYLRERRLQGLYDY